jgi:hypothetical protein
MVHDVTKAEAGVTWPVIEAQGCQTLVQLSFGLPKPMLGVRFLKRSFWQSAPFKIGGPIRP